MRPLLERYAGPLYGAVILPRLGNARPPPQELLRDTLSTAVEKISRFTWQGKSMYPWLRHDRASTRSSTATATTRAAAAHRRRAGARGTDEASAPGPAPTRCMIVEQEPAAPVAHRRRRMLGPARAIARPSSCG
jgi:hypothetical protein